ncbi:MAG: carbohydrate kinase [Actinomycetota bacterium]|nr:carbohydrate kinase [Actinomycetota bacterium]
MIVVAGEALVDLVIDTEGNVKAKLGGGPYNVARTIGRLGLPVSFLGAISTDRFGSRLFAQLEADGVQADTIVRTDLPTTLAAAELDERGAATYHFYFAGTSAPSLQQVPPAARAARALHAGTLGLVLEPMATTLLHLMAQLPDDTLLMLDPNCRTGVISDRAAYVQRVEAAYVRSDVVKVSTDDALYLDPSTEPMAYSRALVQRGVQLVLLTDGANGTWVVTADGDELVPTERIEVADTIGAGDSFGGAFLAWWLHHGLTRGDLGNHTAAVEATSAAQEVSAITCQRVGAEPPYRRELSPRWQTQPA